MSLASYSADQPTEQGDQKQNEENEEEDLRNTRRRNGDSTETEYRSHNRDNEKSYGPA
jgi:hypothetical protein